MRRKLLMQMANQAATGRRWMSVLFRMNLQEIMFKIFEK